MKFQVIQDDSGKNTGVFIPMEEWTLIKANYPDIETLETRVPDWQKDLLDARLAAIEQNPKRLKSIEGLLGELDRDI